MVKVKVLVPEGYESIPTMDVVDNRLVEIYPFKLAAKTRAENLNDERFVETIRWEVEKIGNRKAYARVFEVKHGRKPRLFERFFARWAVVPYQNVLKKKGEVYGR